MPLAVGGQWNSDYSRSYLPTAEALAAGQPLDTLPDALAIRYPIGFPLFIAVHIRLAALLGLSLSTALFASQVLVAALTTTLLFLLAERLFGAFPALLAAGLWTLYPRALWYIRHPNSEVLFTFLLHLALFCVLLLYQQRRLGWALGAGALIGAAALVRPIALVLGPLVALWLLWQRHLAWRQRLGAALLLLVANALVLLPWEVYLWQREGRIIPLSVNGSSSVYDGITWAVAEGSDPRAALLPDDVLALQQRAAARGETLRYESGALRGFLWEEAMAHPLTVAKLVLIKMGRALYANQGGSNERALLVGIVPLLVFVLWGVRGAWAARAQRSFTLLLLAIFLYNWAMATLVLSIGRYLVPVTGLLFVLCGYTLARFAERYVLPRLPTRLTRYLPR